MSSEELEERLARYEPSPAPPGLKEAIVDRVLLRERGRRRTRWAIAAAAAALLASVLLDMDAERVYREAVRLADGDVRLRATEPARTAPILSLDVPGAPALLHWNGAYHE